MQARLVFWAEWVYIQRDLVGDWFMQAKWNGLLAIYRGRTDTETYTIIFFLLIQAKPNSVQLQAMQLRASVGF